MSLISKLNKAFDHRIRLGIMSILVVNDHADFKSLKELLDVTDGNLASHSKALEKENFIRVEKTFINRKPNTKYIATDEGKNAFQEHITALEKIISKND
ncbi:transcriptional regulator [Nonlabens spongiae]|uniref:Transcriptional regulator n=1 Tax=Nonlabens spongiae TaxID=331648 RepID=A0A1W6MNN0_9FLAO|nr:transcriptional regulator [Nonlabens spongiae]ARN79214.1 transcriptional regulator [Nonlabens spongiae]